MIQAGQSLPAALRPDTNETSTVNSSQANSIRAPAVAGGPVIPLGTTPSSAAANPAEHVGTMLKTPTTEGVEGIRFSTSGADHPQAAVPARRFESAAERAGPQLKLPEGSALKRAEKPGESVFDQLVRALRLRTTARSSSATVRLEPPELGRMLVEVHMDRDALRIAVRTETDAAREIVQHRAAELNAALQRQGIWVQRFEVSVDPRMVPWVPTAAPGSSFRGRSSSNGWESSTEPKLGNVDGLEEIEKGSFEGLESRTIGAAAWRRRLDIQV
jgi:flagellar hook-length control protein FliK